MPIKTVEIICVPCDKCERLKKDVADIIKGIEFQNKVKIFYEFKHTPTLREITTYSLNPSQTPALIVNGNVEMAGKIERVALKSKLEALNRY